MELVKQASRKDRSTTTLHLFDIDETLFAHDHDKLKIYVKDSFTGQVIRTLTNQEFNDYVLKEGQELDFSEFRCPERFGQSARPIQYMVDKLKEVHKTNKNVELLTARADFTDKESFARQMARFGIDISQIHVRRAGNLPLYSAEGKARVVEELINKHHYDIIHFYDDNLYNLLGFKALQNKYPAVTFHAYQVTHDSENGTTQVTKL